MSAPHTQNQAEDRINYKTLGLVAFISLALFAVSIVWANSILVRTRGDEAADPTPEIGKAEVGIVDQLQFNMDMRAETLRASKLEKLSSYGWVDPARNLVHVPVELAMQQYVKTAAAPPPAPVAPQAPETAPGEAPQDGTAPAGQDAAQPGTEGGEGSEQK